MTLDPLHPATGIYEGIPARTYHQIRACGSTTLKAMRRSAAHARYQLDHPKESDAMLVGEATHMAILQPEIFKDYFAVAPECDRRTKEGKEIWKAACVANVGKSMLKAEQMECVKAMALAVRAHEGAMTLLPEEGQTELTIIWHDTETDLMCKARLDKLVEPAITDLKTTTDARPDKFAKSIYEFGYEIQAAYYLMGATEAGLDVESFAIVAVENEPYHGVAAYELEAEAIAMGHETARELLNRYAECLRTGVWDCYPTQINRIGLPEWVMRREERKGTVYA